MKNGGLRRFGAVVLIGFVGGSFCGFLQLVAISYFTLQAARSSSLSQSRDILSFAIFSGIEFGGLFGIIVFPLCYYVFLRKLDLQSSLFVIVPATVLTGWLALLLPGFRDGFLGGDSVLSVLGFVFGPSFLGLLLSSIALRIFARKAEARGGP